ncbi:unnamed protein product, partial [Rotaria sp. Silwood1]
VSPGVNHTFPAPIGRHVTGKDDFHHLSKFIELLNYEVDAVLSYKSSAQRLSNETGRRGVGELIITITITKKVILRFLEIFTAGSYIKW